MADLTLDQALPVIQDLAQRKANAFVRRFGFAIDERDDVASQLLLTFLIRWPKFDNGRASVRTFASRVMDKALTSILRRHLAPSRMEQEVRHDVVRFTRGGLYHCGDGAVGVRGVAAGAVDAGAGGAADEELMFL